MLLASLSDGTKYRADLFELINFQSDPQVGFEMLCTVVQRVIETMPEEQQQEILAGILTEADTQHLDITI